MTHDSDRRLHVGIIMDGNGRWATARGWLRAEGHRQGAATVTAVVDAAVRAGIGTLTLYAFSADNWRRPGDEVRALFALFDEHVRGDLARAASNGVRVSLVGRRDRLPPALRRSAALLERATGRGTALHVRLAIDYSGREAIWLAAEQAMAAGRSCTREEFAARVRSGSGDLVDVPDVDLVIRTGGDLRLSDFLLWEAAYAELWFTDVAWPDFTTAHLTEALAAYGRRERRFGGLPAAALQA